MGLHCILLVLNFQPNFRRETRNNESPRKKLVKDNFQRDEVGDLKSARPVMDTTLTSPSKDFALEMAASVLGSMSNALRVMDRACIGFWKAFTAISILGMAVTKLRIDTRIWLKISLLFLQHFAIESENDWDLRIKQAGTLCPCWRLAPTQLLSLQPPDRHQQCCNSLFKLWKQRGAEVTESCQITWCNSECNWVVNIVDVNVLMSGCTSSASRHLPSLVIWILTSA